MPAPPASPPPYYDVSDDDGVTALDVLMVINYINSHPTASGEGESPTAGDRDRPESSRLWTEPYDVIFAAEDEDVQVGVGDLDLRFNPKGLTFALRRKGSRRS